jgi:hypothetical protein
MTPVYASGYTVPTISNITSLADVFFLATNVVLAIGIALTVIFLILGGIQYMTAKGDVKAAGEARQALTNAIIGFIIVVAAYTIRTVLINVLGVSNIDANDPFSGVGI